MTQDEPAIRNLVDTWMTASKTGDKVRLLSLLADDAVFMTPGREPFGKEVFFNEPSNGPVEGKADVRELKVLGDWAYARTYTSLAISSGRVRGDGAPARYEGWTLTLLKKGADGKWRIARDASLVMPQS